MFWSIFCILILHRIYFHSIDSILYICIVSFPFELIQIISIWKSLYRLVSVTKSSKPPEKSLRKFKISGFSYVEIVVPNEYIHTRALKEAVFRCNILLYLCCWSFSFYCILRTVKSSSWEWLGSLSLQYTYAKDIYIWIIKPSKILSSRLRSLPHKPYVHRRYTCIPTLNSKLNLYLSLHISFRTFIQW